MNNEKKLGNLSIADFVSETIIQISDGLQRAQDAKRDNGVKILPDSFGDSTVSIDISFDLAVTQALESSGERGFKINVLFAGVDFGNSADNKNSFEAVNRIQFSLPVHMTVYNSPNSVSPYSNEDWNPQIGQ